MLSRVVKSSMSNLRTLLSNGLPGWMWAGALTVTAILLALQDRLTSQFVTLVLGSLAVWLGYRGWTKVEEAEESRGDSEVQNESRNAS